MQMASYTFATATSGDWNTGTLWTGGTAPSLVPNAIDATATIDATGTQYVVKIASTESITLAGLTLGSVANGGTLEMDGTLTLTGSGTIDGSLQGEILSNG